MDIALPDLHRRGGFPLMAEKEKEKMKQTKKSSPAGGEPVNMDLTENVSTKNIAQEPTDVKEGIESLMNIIFEIMGGGKRWLI